MNRNNIENIGFIGAGKMAGALIKAFINKKVFDVHKIIASDKDPERLVKISKETGIQTAGDNCDVVSFADIVVLSVKPFNVLTVLEEIKDKVQENQYIVSIAAGVQIRKIEAVIPQAKVVRVMPNTPALIGEMAGAYTGGTKTTDSDMALVGNILHAAGKVFPVEERLLDAVTGLSGSGPAFVAYFIEAMIDEGVSQGLDINTARSLTLQTFEGTAKLLSETGLSPSELISMVTTPSGTTYAGQQVLDALNVKKIIRNTIAAAVERSKELDSGE